MEIMEQKNGADGRQNINLNKTVLIVVAAVLALFLVMILIPQSFWVNLSIKLFK
jgi:hypothetical protein